MLAMMATEISLSIQPKVEAMALSLQGNPKLAQVFRDCFMSTIRTTTEFLEDGTVFVITGDIPAMWLRDSSCQVRHYVRLAREDEDVAALLRGLIRKQFRYIAIDPYANAFNKTACGAGHADDITIMAPWIWERKYEIDSLCYPVWLAYHYWEATHDRSPFEESFRDGLAAILDLWTREQRHETESRYSFERPNAPDSDTLPNGGKGLAVGYTGMTWSGFRPSDDACTYGYLIPANMFAVVVLDYIAKLAEELYSDSRLAQRARALRHEIDTGIREYGTVEHPKYGRIWAYEVDGLGHSTLMDDANVPSLLAAPYLGYCAVDDPIYIATRRFVLSQDNPYFYCGSRASGVGSQHTKAGYVWPIGMMMQALTSSDAAEQVSIVASLLTTDAGTGAMHESFDPDDPSVFTRQWFAWADSLFAELVCELPKTYKTHCRRKTQGGCLE